LTAAQRALAVSQGPRDGRLRLGRNCYVNSCEEVLPGPLETLKSPRSLKCSENSSFPVTACCNGWQLQLLAVMQRLALRS
jgi:hypothetical protein